MLSQEHKFCMDMTVLEKQQARLKWLQQHFNFVNQNINTPIEPYSMQQYQDFFDHAAAANGDHVVDNWKRKPETHLGSSGQPNVSNNISGNGLEFGGNKMDFFQAEEGTSCLEIDYCLSRTSSCQKGAVELPTVEKEVMLADVAGEDEDLMDKEQTLYGRETKSKRGTEFAAAENRNDKRKKREAEGDSNVRENISADNSVDSSKEVLKKQDYIHVRARRGQATDSHSLAERARREKISKKMKCLQDLVPGCNKITGRAGMLDEIINYVQSLQRQVEFLSMKLAALTPRIESATDNFSIKEFPAYAANYPTTIAQLPNLQANIVQHEVTGSEQEVLTTDRTTSSSAFMPALDSSCFPVQPFWESDMQNLHNVGFHQG